MLSDTDKQLLEIAGGYYRHPGARDQAYRDVTGGTAIAASQRINALLDEPAALAWNPTLVKRLRRLREARTSSRGHRVPHG